MRLKSPAVAKRGVKLFGLEHGDQILTQTMRRVALLGRQTLAKLVAIMRRLRVRHPSGARWNGPHR
jgi:hypothetical protein